MKISVNKPNFDDDFKSKIQKSTAKAVHSSIIENDIILVKVFSQERIVGVFTFIKDDDKLMLKKNQIIERDYYPFEFCILEVVKYFKRKKIKTIEW